MNFAPVELDEELQAFQAEVRAFCEKTITDDVHDEEYRTGDGHNWKVHRALGQRGWLFPDWPTNEGGAGLDSARISVLNFELRRAHPPRTTRASTALSVGAVKTFGNDELKAEVIDGVARGELLSCLGWSEPDAGSDIAGVSCRAELDGAEWVVNGTKAFMSSAHNCDYSFLLTRTDPDVPKHKGLTMFLAPLRSPGVEIIPVKTYGGERFNTVVFDNVRIPDRYRLGGVNEGWAVISHPLAQEHGEDPSLAYRRDVEGFAVPLRAALDDALEWARSTTRANGTRAIDDPVVRVRLARSALACIVAGDAPVGPVRRVINAEVLVEGSGDLVDLVGPASLIERGETGVVGTAGIDCAYRIGPATTIYGGTTDIHRSMLAERIGLPRTRPSA